MLFLVELLRNRELDLDPVCCPGRTERLRDVEVFEFMRDGVFERWTLLARSGPLGKLDMRLARSLALIDNAGSRPLANGGQGRVKVEGASWELLRVRLEVPFLILAALVDVFDSVEVQLWKDLGDRLLGPDWDLSLRLHEPLDVAFAAHTDMLTASNNNGIDSFSSYGNADTVGRLGFSDKTKLFGRSRLRLATRVIPLAVDDRRD